MERNLNILHGAVNATQTSSKEDSQLHVMKNEEGRRFHPDLGAEQGTNVTRQTA